MLEAVKLFLLKRKIGYRHGGEDDYEDVCRYCIAYKPCPLYYCDRFKFMVDGDYDYCNHFAPRQISAKDMVELEKAKSHIQGIFNGLMGIINGGRNGL